MVSCQHQFLCHSLRWALERLFFAKYRRIKRKARPLHKGTGRSSGRCGGKSISIRKMTKLFFKLLEISKVVTVGNIEANPVRPRHPSSMSQQASTCETLPLSTSTTPRSRQRNRPRPYLLHTRCLHANPDLYSMVSFTETPLISFPGASVIRFWQWPSTT